MQIKDFRMGWRLLLQKPAYSTVMVLGLALGFAVWFLALGFSRYEFGYDKHVPGLAQVYVLKASPNWGAMDWSENVPLAMKESLEKSGVPMDATAVLPFPVAVRVGDVVSNVELTVVDPAFGKVFGLHARDGDLAAALDRPDAVAVSEDTALTLFGDTHAVGRQVQVNGQLLRVAAVLARQPKTSSLQFQMLAGLGSAAWPAAERERARDSWNYYADDGKNTVVCKVYLRLPDAGRVKQVQAAVAADVERSALRAHLSQKNLAEIGAKPMLQVALGPLADSYLDFEARSNSGVKGDPLANYAMNGVALLILLLTVGNYVNLANIRVVQRQREIAVRKVLGVTPARLAAQMVAESVLVSLLAALLGAVLALLLLPAWSSLTEHDIPAVLGAADYGVFAALVVVAGLLVGIAAGLYPAWTAMKMRVTPVLSGRNGSDTAGGLLLRRILTVVQFGIAMFVTAMIVTVAWQIEYLKGIDYGYKVDGLMVVKLPAGATPSAFASFKGALERLPELRGVTASSASAANTEFLGVKGDGVTLGVRQVGPEYFSVLGLGIAAGRGFNAAQDTGEHANVVVMNRLAALRLGYPDETAAVGQFIKMNGKTVQVVGISKNVSNGFMAGAPRPVVYALTAAPAEVTLRAAADMQVAETAVAQLWRQHFPDQYLVVRNQKAQLQMNAGGPQAILQTCVVVAAVIIPLAVFSIYVLSAFAVQRRAREFVMRKLYGARPADIARLLVREFGILQGIAALIGLPLAYVAGRAFVERFTEQAAVGPWALVAALLGALLITLLATLRHVIAASRLAPAQALRTA